MKTQWECKPGREEDSKEGFIGIKYYYNTACMLIVIIYALYGTCCIMGITILFYSFFTQGSNYLWHVDAYEKLNPYGFTIHGCIDG